MSAHIVYYGGYKIVFDNGVYRIVDLPIPGFLDLSDAKAHIDEMTKDEVQKG